MLKLGTVFSGIGAVEHALERLNIPYEIQFACDNGERKLKAKYEEIEEITKGMNNSERNAYITQLYNLTDAPAPKPSTPDTVTEFPATPFSVKVIIDDLNYRSEPSMNGKVNGQTGKGTFTIMEVRNGGWGRLKSGAGWIWLSNPTYCTVGKTVKITEDKKKSIDELAKEVIRGDWGNGTERKEKLTAAGYDYAAIQKRVNEMLK